MLFECRYMQNSYLTIRKNVKFEVPADEVHGEIRTLLIVPSHPLFYK